MTQWSERSPEVAALLNPAFSGILLHQSIDGYCSQRSDGMPYELAALVLPLVLHGETAAALPPSVRTPLLSWIAATPIVRIGFVQRVRASLTVFREGLIFGMSHSVVVAGDKGRLQVGRTRAAINRLGSDVRRHAQAAALVGRLFAKAGNSATIYAAFGIKP